ncbi:MAG: hypothetical protein ACKVOG_12015 [Rhodoglobus sp.]
MEAGDTSAALTLLDDLPTEAVAEYQPYWVCRARVLRAFGDTAGADAARYRAVGLTTNPAVRSYLLGT